METWQVVVLVVLVLLVVALALLWRQRSRRRALQERFGPEYDRAVAHGDGRRQAERELDERLARRRELDVRPLPPARRDEYSATWQEVQAAFVDQPADSVADARTLCRAVMQERGYPTDEGSLDVVSVDHPDVVQDYRAADGLAGAAADGRASTEDLRQAMVHYRALFARLLEDGADAR